MEKLTGPGDPPQHRHAEYIPFPLLDDLCTEILPPPLQVLALKKSEAQSGYQERKFLVLVPYYGFIHTVRPTWSTRFDCISS